MSSNRGQDDSWDSHVIIRDLGVEEERVQPLEGTAPTREGRRWGIVAIGSLCLIGIVTSLPTSDSEYVSREIQEPDKRVDVCQEVMRANSSERSGVVESEEPENSTLPSGYTLMGVWPQGDREPVIYGVQHPDRSVEVCNDEEQPNKKDFPTFLGPNEVGSLPKGFSYAYEPSLSATNRELKLIGVRGEDGSIQTSITLEDGQIRPLEKNP